MSYEKLKNSRRRRKEDIVWVMGESCQLCGYNKDITALDLHHINPEEKDFSFNSADSRNWQSVRDELEKCILLCSNCHREIHSGFNTSILKTSFAEERAEIISDKINDLKIGKLQICKDCGTIISKGAERCLICDGLTKRKVTRPSREDLKIAIRNESFVSLSKKFAVSDNAIRKWCIKYNLPSKKTEIAKISDFEWDKI